MNATGTLTPANAIPSLKDALSVQSKLTKGFPSKLDYGRTLTYRTIDKGTVKDVTNKDFSKNAFSDWMQEKLGPEYKPFERYILSDKACPDAVAEYREFTDEETASLRRLLQLKVEAFINTRLYILRNAINKYRANPTSFNVLEPAGFPSGDDTTEAEINTYIIENIDNLHFKNFITSLGLTQKDLLPQTKT